MQPQPNSVAFTGLPPEYAIPSKAASLAEARAYCKRLALSHYENFSVVTWFLPERLHQHFYNVYAYCRISDDLGDEVGDPQQSLRLLDEWEGELNATYESLAGSGREGTASALPNNAENNEPRREGTASAVPNNAEKRMGALAPEGPRHPVFIALRETIRECDIPREPFADLLTAFRRDQTITRHATFEALLDYCHYSANPVGRLVLYLCGYRDQHRQQLSDFTCTALQLANFWQDVAVDYDKGRIYLPLEDMARFGVDEGDIARRHATPQFLEMMRYEVQRAREWFQRGAPLAASLDRELALDIELFTRGGQEILNAIERQGYDVLKRRPALSKSRKLLLVARAALGKLR